MFFRKKEIILQKNILEKNHRYLEKRKIFEKNLKITFLDKIQTFFKKSGYKSKTRNNFFCQHPLGHIDDEESKKNYWKNLDFSKFTLKNYLHLHYLHQY